MCESAMDEELQKGYYISPKIELVQIPGKGRGFIAREALKVGELIFKEKPLAVEERSGDWHNKFVRVLIDRKEERELIYCPPKYPILPSPINEVSNDEYSRMISQITTNAFQKGSTAVLTARSNLFNSSCCPNLVLHCKDNFELWGYVIENIQAGEEIFNNFPDLYLPTRRRRDLLKNQYGFDCDCKRCNQPELFPSDKLLVAAFELPDDANEKQQAVDHMEKIYNSLDYGTPTYDQKFEENPVMYIEQLESFIKQPFGSRWPNAFLGKCHWRLNVVRHNLVQELMAAGKLERAIDVLIDQMIANDKILPKWHLQKLAPYNTLNELMARLNMDRLQGAITRLKKGEVDLQYYKELFFMYNERQK